MSHLEDVLRSQLTVLKVMEQAIYGRHSWAMKFVPDDDAPSFSVPATVQAEESWVGFFVKMVEPFGSGVLFLLCDGEAMLSRPIEVEEKAEVRLDLAVPNPASASQK